MRVVSPGDKSAVVDIASHTAASNMATNSSKQDSSEDALDFSSLVSGAEELGKGDNDADVLRVLLGECIEEVCRRYVCILLVLCGVIRVFYVCDPSNSPLLLLWHCFSLCGVPSLSAVWPRLPEAASSATRK